MFGGTRAWLLLLLLQLLRLHWRQPRVGQKPSPITLCLLGVRGKAATSANG